MGKGRMEAFSDGVIAILMTIMVFDLKPPHATDGAALLGMTPLVLSYLLSFLYLGIYWNNHHHMLAIVQRVSGGTLWANLHLLFWLSLLPFATNWLQSSGFQPVPTAVYGVVLLCAAFGFLILQRGLIRLEGDQSRLKSAIGNDLKGKISLGLYVLGVVLAMLEHPLPAMAAYAIVSLIWLIPDRRVEVQLERENATSMGKK
jgi:uncharacterized membrane protein